MIGDGDGDAIPKGGVSIAEASGGISKAGDGISKDDESKLVERRLVEDMGFDSGSPAEKSAERVSYSEALTVGSSGVELKPDFIVKEGVAEVAIPEAGCVSPNGFQLLQDMREEGEIDEEEEVEEVGSEVEE
ncbi:unnamed protein product, partial [Brassica rapa subsp. trilocularis]